MGDWLGILALVDEEKLKQAHAAYEAAHPTVPPLHVMPQTDPVSALKNQTALQNQLTPEAARNLYNTSVRYNVRSVTPQDTELAHYQLSMGNPNLPLTAQELVGRTKLALGLRPNPEITLTAQEPYSPQPEVLMHEFAHKWQNQQMPLDRLSDWQHNWPALVDPWTKERVGGRSDTGDRNMTGGFEAYAHQAEHGPMGMPQEMRGQYYPGLFQPGLGEPPKPQPLMNDNVAMALAKQAEQHQWTPEAAIEQSKLPGPWQWKQYQTDVYPPTNSFTTDEMLPFNYQREMRDWAPGYLAPAKERWG